MKKKTDDELGILLTREIKNMMFNEKLTAEQRVDIFCAIVGGKELENPVLESFAEALKTGFIHANDARKSSIYNKRERDKHYQRRSTPIDADQRRSTTIDADQRQSSLYGNGNGNGNGNDIPLPPKGGKGEKSPDAISPEDIMYDHDGWAEKFAAEIAKWYPYEVNPDGLKKVLIGKSKKNLRRALEDGMAAWIDSGAWDEKRFIPPDIVKWIKLERFLDQPQDKKTSAARTDGERQSAAPSADATMAMIQSDGEE